MMDNNFFKDALLKAHALTKFGMENGIRLIQDESLIGTLTMKCKVDRRGRSDEEIDQLMRQYKILLMSIVQWQECRVLYKII